MSKDQCIPHLEWETIDSPLIVNNIEFDKLKYNISDDTVLKVWRNDEFGLEARLEGFTNDPSTFKKDQLLDDGNIIIGDTITGISTHGSRIILSKCIITTWTTKSFYAEEKGYVFEAIVHLDSCDIIYNIPNPEVGSVHHLDWFICSRKADLDFRKVTLRKRNSSKPKIRLGIDEEDPAADPLSGSSSSCDYFQMEIRGARCIIAKVPSHYLPLNLKGICFEIRDQANNIITEHDKKDLRNLLEFLLGTELVPIGYSELNNGELIRAFLDTPYGGSIKTTCRNAMPVLTFNRQYEWGNIEWLTRTLFPKYQELKNPLQIDQVLSRFFIAMQTPLGANLPILANAIEILAGRYLKMTDKLNIEYLPDDEFSLLIEDEIESLRSKMQHIEGYEVMLNKIKSVYKRNPAEKILSFFNYAGIQVGRTEKKAIALRNKMTHSVRDYKIEKNVQSDLMCNS